MKAPSTPNLREHWSARAKRAKKQKADTRLLCPRWTYGPLLVVRLTRVGPKELDSDNLQGALKAVRDGVASWLKVDDASPLVEWKYVQEKGKAGVRIEAQLAPARYDSELNPTSMFDWVGAPPP